MGCQRSCTIVKDGLKIRMRPEEKPKMLRADEGLLISTCLPTNPRIFNKLSSTWLTFTLKTMSVFKDCFICKIFRHGMLEHCCQLMQRVLYKAHHHHQQQQQQRQTISMDSDPQ